MFVLKNIIRKARIEVSVIINFIACGVVIIFIVAINISMVVHKDSRVSSVLMESPMNSS